MFLSITARTNSHSLSAREQTNHRLLIRLSSGLQTLLAIDSFLRQPRIHVQLVPPGRDVEEDVAVEELIPLAGVHGVRSGAQKPNHARICRDCLGNDGFEHGKRVALLADGPGINVVIRLAGEGLLVEPVATAMC